MISGLSADCILPADAGGVDAEAMVWSVAVVLLENRTQGDSTSGTERADCSCRTLLRALFRLERNERRRRGERTLDNAFDIPSMAMTLFSRGSSTPSLGVQHALPFLTTQALLVGQLVNVAIKPTLPVLMTSRLRAGVTGEPKSILKSTNRELRWRRTE